MKYKGVLNFYEKKFLTVFLAVVAVVSLAACGNGGESVVTEPYETENAEHIHVYNEVVALEPTCTYFGKVENKCECGLVDGVKYLPMRKHDANEATCGVDSVCKTCGEILTEKYDHVFVETVLTEMTCTVDGVVKNTCYRCGFSKEEVTDAHHVFGRLESVNGKYEGVCSACSKKISDVKVVDLHNEKTSGLSYENGKMKFVGGGSKFSYKLPAEIVGDEATPYQIDFTLTFDKGASEGSVMERVYNKGSGRNLLTYNGTYNSILRQYPVSDGAGSYLTDTVEIKSLISFSVDPIPLVRMRLGDSVKITLFVTPSEKTVDIYIDGEYIATRDGEGSLPADSAQIRFGDGEASATGYTVSNVHIIRAVTD